MKLSDLQGFYSEAVIRSESKAGVRKRLKIRMYILGTAPECMFKVTKNKELIYKGRELLKAINAYENI